MSDRLTLAHAFEDAGIARDKAEGLATAIFDAIRENVATKQEIDLQTVTKAEILIVRAGTAVCSRRFRPQVNQALTCWAASPDQLGQHCAPIVRLPSRLE
jgi:hypothetical protein